MLDDSNRTVAESDHPCSAVVLGLSPTGLYVARELGRAGIGVLGVEKEFACASWSRYVTKSHGLLKVKSPTLLLQRLLDHAHRCGEKPVLVPTSDYYIDFVMANYSRLSSAFRVSEAYGDKAGVFLDKFRFSELCRELGVASPGVWQVSGIDDLQSIAAEIQFPCILKPVFIHLAKPYLAGKKLLVMDDMRSLCEVLSNMPSFSGGWLVQELVPGAESEITLLAGVSVQPAAYSDTFTARKLRQYPPGFGSASLVTSEQCDQTRNLTGPLMDAVGYRGIYGAEFKRDPRDGELKVIEINPRPTLWFHVSNAAGKRLVERHYRDLCGIPLEPTEQQKNDVLWRYFIKDTASRLFYSFKGDKFVLPVPDIGAARKAETRCWAVFDKSDPLPAIAELGVYLGKMVRRLF